MSTNEVAVLVAHPPRRGSAQNAFRSPGEPTVEGHPRCLRSPPDPDSTATPSSDQRAAGHRGRRLPQSLGVRSAPRVGRPRAGAASPTGPPIRAGHHPATPVRQKLMHADIPQPRDAGDRTDSSRTALADRSLLTPGAALNFFARRLTNRLPVATSDGERLLQDGDLDEGSSREDEAVVAPSADRLRRAQRRLHRHRDQVRNVAEQRPDGGRASSE